MNDRTTKGKAEIEAPAPEITGRAEVTRAEFTVEDVKDLAADVFRSYLQNHLDAKMEIGHLAKLSIAAAWAFRKAWENRPAEPEDMKDVKAMWRQH